MVKSTWFQVLLILAALHKRGAPMRFGRNAAEAIAKKPRDYTRVNLPALRARVLTYTRFGLPSTRMRTFCTLTPQERLVLLFAWDTLLPDFGDLPVT
jgi:hypothetical protein